jgi:hypothetical protein
MKPECADTTWEKGWDGHEWAQMRRLARLSLAEKIQWLEEAQELVLHLSQARQTTGQSARPG